MNTLRSLLIVFLAVGFLVTACSQTMEKRKPGGRAPAPIMEEDLNAPPSAPPGSPIGPPAPPASAPPPEPYPSTLPAPGEGYGEDRKPRRLDFRDKRGSGPPSRPSTPFDTRA